MKIFFTVLIVLYVVAVIVYGIYVIHTAVTNRWKTENSEKEKFKKISK